MNAIAKGWMRSTLSNILEDDDIEGESNNMMDEFISQYQASAYVMSPLTMEMESKRERTTTTSTSSSMLTQRVQITEIVSTSNLSVVVSDCQCTIPAYITKRSWAKLVSNRGSTTLSNILGGVIKLKSYRFVPTDVIEFAMLNDLRKMKSRQKNIPMRPMVCLLIDDFELMGSQGSAQFGTNPLPFPCDAREKKLLSDAVQNRTLMKKLFSMRDEDLNDGFKFPSFRESQIPDAFEASDLKRAIDLAGAQWIPSKNDDAVSTKVQDDEEEEVEEDAKKEEEEDDDDSDDFEVCSVSSHEEIEEKEEEETDEEKEEEENDEEIEEENDEEKEEDNEEEKENKRKRKDMSSNNSTPKNRKKRRTEDMKDDDQWMVYITEEDNETLEEIAKMKDAPTLSTLLFNNREHYPSIKASSRLKKGTTVWIEKKMIAVDTPPPPPPPPDSAEEKVEEDEDYEKPLDDDTSEESVDDDENKEEDVDETERSNNNTVSRLETVLLSHADDLLESLSRVKNLRQPTNVPCSLESRVALVRNYYEYSNS